MGCAGSTKTDGVSHDAPVNAPPKRVLSALSVARKSEKTSSQSNHSTGPPVDRLVPRLHDDADNTDIDIELTVEQKTDAFQQRSLRSQDNSKDEYGVKSFPKSSTTFAITFGNVCEDSDGTDAIVLSLDAGDMENCGVSRWTNRVSVGREVQGGPLGEVELEIPTSVPHTAIAGGSYHVNQSRGLQVPYDVSWDNLPCASIEVWVMPVSWPSTTAWLISQEDKNDSKNFKRGIALQDSRFGGTGGIGVGSGVPYESTLTVPELHHWHHIVATFENNKECWVYHRAPGLNLEEKQSYTCDNDPGLEIFTIGGLELHENHHVDVYISQVNVFNRVLSSQEVEERYRMQCARYLAAEESTA